MADLFGFRAEDVTRIAEAVRKVEGGAPIGTGTQPGQRPNVIFAKVTAAGTGGDGFYVAEQVIWNGTIFVTNSLRQFDTDSGSYGELLELNRSPDVLPFSGGGTVIVLAWIAWTTSGSPQWCFIQGGGDEEQESDIFVFKSRTKEATDNTVEIGYLRDDSSYTLRDSIYIYDYEGSVVPIDDSGASREVTGLSGDGFIWYELSRNDTGPAWSIDSVAFGPVYPESPQEFGQLYLLIGTFADAGTSNFSWNNILRTSPMLWVRGFEEEFAPTYEGGDSSGAMVRISSGKVDLIHGTSGTVAEKAFPLSSDTFIFVEVVNDAGVPGAVVNGTLQEEATAPDYQFVTGTNELTVKYLIGFIASGVYFKVHTGRIFLNGLYQTDFALSVGGPTSVNMLTYSTLVEIDGAVGGGSNFLEGFGHNFQWKASGLKDEGALVTLKLGGTDDDVSYAPLVDADTPGAGIIRFTQRSRSLSVTSGLVQTNANASASDVDLQLTQITMITDIQLSSNDDLEIKTRTAYVLDPGTESAFSTVTGWVTTECPVPSSP